MLTYSQAVIKELFIRVILIDNCKDNKTGRGSLHETSSCFVGLLSFSCWIHPKTRNRPLSYSEKALECFVYSKSLFFIISLVEFGEIFAVGND